MATTSPPCGAGKESAASGTRDRAAPGDALEARELVGGGDDRRRALGRLLVQVLQALALRVAGVVGALVAVPAPVPELAAGARPMIARAERVLQRVEDHDDARLAARGGAACAPGAAPGARRPRRRRRAGSRAKAP